MLPDYYQILLKIYDKVKIPVLEYIDVPDSVEVLDEYWLVPNFSKVQIRRDLESYKTEYMLIEPVVARNELELLNFIYEDIRKKLVLKEFLPDTQTKTTILFETLDELMDEYALRVEDELTLKLLYYFFRNFFGFGPIDSLLVDPYLEDISCDGYDIPIYAFHSKYGGLPTNVKFSKNELDTLVLLLGQKSGKHVSYATPLIDATLPDGSRIQLTYGLEVTTRGSTFTIRKFKAEPFTPIDLISFGTLNSGILAYYWLLIENKMSFMVIGETAAGKTTTMNALMMFIPPEDKVVSIEDTREIQLHHENWIPGVTRSGIEGQDIEMYDLLRAALRQRPDYIIVGEVRGAEAQTLFQAMSTGHAAYSTFHSGDVQQLIYRLENEPLEVPRVMIQFLDSVIIQFMWVRKGVRKRRAREILEIVGIDPVNKDLLINTVFRWDPPSDTFTQVADSKKLEKIAELSGADITELIDELVRRREFLEMMYKKNIRDYVDVTKYIHMYYRNSEKAIELLKEVESGEE
jgi:flagellar protein FlaI